MPSRTCVTSVPETTEFSYRGRIAGGSWTRQPRLIFIDADADHSAAGSIQSKFTFDVVEFSAMTPASCIAISRTSFRSALTGYRPTHRRTDCLSLKPAKLPTERKCFASAASSFRMKPVPGRWIAIGLRKKVVLQLDSEWQIKPDRTSPDIGTPTFDIGITLKQIVQPFGRLWLRVNRGILW